MISIQNALISSCVRRGSSLSLSLHFFGTHIAVYFRIIVLALKKNFGSVFDVRS
jgi:hypothetical protein